MNRLNFLPLFTICFCLGICWAKFTHTSFSFLYTLAWIFLILGFIFVGYNNSVWIILFLAVFLGGLFLANTYILPYPHIRNFTFYKSEPVIIRGVVANFPQVKSNFSSFVLTAQELTWAGKIYPVCGRVLVKIFRRVDVSYADQLVLQGKLFRPYQAKNASFSYRDYLQSQGVYSILTVNKNKSIRYLAKSKANPLKFIAYKIRKKAEDILFNNLYPTQAGIYSAMILGERSKVPSRVRRLFIQTGTVHILAISGLHVGIVGFILGLFLKVLGIKRRARYLIIIFLLVLYCVLTGARPSVIRATIMAIVLLVGFLLRTEARISHSLSGAALVILMVNPCQLFNLGFKLSFLSVISIVYLSPLIKNLCNPKSKLLRFIFSGFCVSLAAWLATLPLIAYYFKIISPITVLANLVVVPYLALVITLGFSLLIVGFILPALVPVFAGPANLSILILIQIIKFFNQIPAAYFYL